MDDPVKRIGLEEYMNSVLVANGVRPGFLVQWIDYDEDSAEDPKTKAKLDGIKATFPNLVSTVHEEGALVTLKEKAPTEPIVDSAAMGKALGYLCADEYEYILDHDDEEVTYAFHLMAEVAGEDNPVQLFANRCRAKDIEPQMNAIAESADKVLHSDPRIGSRVTSVYVEIDERIPLNAILRRLFDEQTLTEEEDAQLRNHIWNVLGERIRDYEFEGGLIDQAALYALALYVKHDPFEPYYGFTSEQDKSYREVTETWMASVIDDLDNSKTYKPPTKTLPETLLGGYAFQPKNPSHNGVLLVLHGFTNADPNGFLNELKEQTSTEDEGEDESEDEADTFESRIKQWTEDLQVFLDKTRNPDEPKGGRRTRRRRKIRTYRRRRRV